MFGLGYVGTTTAACLLKDGHEVVGIDVNPEKLDTIGQRPLAGGRAGRRARCWPPASQAGRLRSAQPARPVAGRARPGDDLRRHAEPGRRQARAHPSARGRRASSASAAARRRADDPLLLVFRSTVPPGTMESLVLPTLADAAGSRPAAAYEVAFNPEFLRESTAIKDYYAPPKIVIGERLPGVTRRLKGIYDGHRGAAVRGRLRIAETAKFVDNSFHALKVAFANEIGRICLSQGVDPQAVADVFLADTKLNVSPAYLRPGGPYGGSCLPKDLGAMIALARESGRRGAAARRRARQQRRPSAFPRGRPSASGVQPPGPMLQLGLSFKAGTDDLRNSPLVDMAELLVQAGYELRVFDPDVDPARLLGANFARAAEHRDNVLSRIVPDLAEAAAGARLAILGKPMPGLERHGCRRPCRCSTSRACAGRRRQRAST